MDTPLTRFVAHAKSKGMDAQTLRMVLLSAGWKEKDIAAALVSESLEMSVPVPTDAGSAKDAFFHLLAFATLYSTVINLIILAFQYIDRSLPDATEISYIYTSTAESIRWSVAFIIVSFPLFIFISRAIHREMLHTPEKLASGVRRWLTYLTLFITACTIVGDLVTLLFYFLDGELSLRFLLKVFAILVLTAVPFGYYFMALRMDHEDYKKSSLHRNVFWTSIVVALLFVGYGIYTVGTPALGRSQRFDEERVMDLRALQNQVYDMTYGPERFNTKVFTSLPKPLPKTLDEVVVSPQYQKLRTTDPETGTPYSYSAGARTFQLCATFDLARDQNYDVFWNHPAGEKCFEFDALDPRGK